MVILFPSHDRKGKFDHDFEIQERFNVRSFAEQFMADLEAYGSSGITDIERTATGFVYAWKAYNGIDKQTYQCPQVVTPSNVLRVIFRIDMASINAPTPEKLTSEIDGMQELLEEFSPVLGYEIEKEL